MQYDPLFRTIHIAAVSLSAAGFLARGLGRLFDATWVRARWVRVVPHTVDTVLLGSALLMLWTLPLDPTGQPWLMTKIVGLLIYIGLGMMVMRPRYSARLRWSCFVAALLTLNWIINVALTKSPWGPLAWFF